MRNLNYALIIGGVLALAAPAMGAIPQELMVQGVLRDDSGALQTTSVAVSVKFFNAQTLGVQLGGTVGPNVLPAANGLFSMAIPIGNPDLAALLASPEVWMEVTAGSDTFARSKVEAEMYALAAGTANSLSSSCVGCVSDGMLATSISGSKISGAVASATSATSFAGSLAGDVTGTQGATVVSKIGGVSVVGTGGTNGDVMKLVGGVWTHGTDNAGVTSVTAVSPLASSGGATPAISLTGTVPIANGGTGSTVQNWVDLTNAQTVAGNKTFTGALACSAAQPTVDLSATSTTTLARLNFSESAVGRAAIQLIGSAFGTVARRDTLEIMNATANGAVAILTNSIERFRVDAVGGVAIDRANTNGGFLNNGLTSGAGLTFGGGSGEGIASKRSAGGNLNGVDFYTNFTSRMAISNAGDVTVTTGDLNVTNGEITASKDLNVKGKANIEGDVVMSGSGKVLLDVYIKECPVDGASQTFDCACDSTSDIVMGGGGYGNANTLRESRPLNGHTWRITCFVPQVGLDAYCNRAYAICMRHGK